MCTWCQASDVTKRRKKQKKAKRQYIPVTQDQPPPAYNVVRVVLLFASYYFGDRVQIPCPSSLCPHCEAEKAWEECVGNWGCVGNWEGSPQMGRGYWRVTLWLKKNHNLTSWVCRKHRSLLAGWGCVVLFRCRN